MSLVPDITAAASRDRQEARPWRLWRGLSRRRVGDRSQDEAQWPTAVLPALGRRASTTSGVKLLSCRSGTAPGRVPARAGRGVSQFGTGPRRRGPGGSESANATVFVHPDFPQQEPAAVLFDHLAVGVQNDAVVEVGSLTVPEDSAEPDMFPQSAGSAHEPGAGPPPLTVFDLAHGVVVFALVDSFGFSESVFQFGGIGVEGVYDSLKPYRLRGMLFSSVPFGFSSSLTYKCTVDSWTEHEINSSRLVPPSNSSNTEPSPAPRTCTPDVRLRSEVLSWSGHR